MFPFILHPRSTAQKRPSPRRAHEREAPVPARFRWNPVHRLSGNPVSTYLSRGAIDSVRLSRMWSDVAEIMFCAPNRSRIDVWPPVGIARVIGPEAAGTVCVSYWPAAT